jgi:PAS domain S-box-containing protein
MPKPLPTHVTYDVQAVLDSALSVSLITVTTQGLITGFSRGSERMLGYSAEEVVGKKTPFEFHDHTEIEKRAAELEGLLGHPVDGFQVFVAEVDMENVDEREWIYIRKDGSRITVRLAISELCDQSGDLQGYLGTAVDITRRKATEKKLVQEKHFFDQLINSLPGIFYLYDSDLHLQRWNRNHETLLGYSSDEIKGRYLGDWHSNKEGRDLAVMASKGIIEDGIQLDAVEGGLRHKNGKEIPFLLTGVRVNSPDGPMLAGVGIDLTERKRLEEQLRQSQKMESVGLLAGGVAHDFNNILTIILGNIDLGRVSLEPTSPAIRYLDNVTQAAESAGKLTRQLLAFSRKEVIAPRILDLKMILDGMQGMLTRLLGEDIELNLKQCLDLWSVRIDPGQFDQVLLNLSVNARDAMLDGGSLLIETANCILDEAYTARHPDASAGEYVKISVSDTGTGMTQEVMTHLFEPVLAFLRFLVPLSRTKGLSMCIRNLA